MNEQEDVAKILEKGVDFQLLGSLLDNNISVIRDYVREQIVSKSVSKSVSKPVSKSIEIIDFLTLAKSRDEILIHVGLTNHSKNYKTYLVPLIESGIVEMTFPEKKRSQNQKYRLTEKGRKLLKI